MEAQYKEIREKLTDGCSEDEFKAMRCPVCGGPLVLQVHPSLSMLTVQCIEPGFHIRLHIEPKTSPVWLKAHVGGAWTKDWKGGDVDNELINR